MKQADTLTIIMNTREQRPWTFGGAHRVERAVLPAGDCASARFDSIVAIERRSLDDFVQSITWERDGIHLA
jgi:DNA excision repair protein ERCC-4